MPTTINLRKMLDRKSWTMCNPLPVTNAANMLVIDAGGADQSVMYITSATVVYMYDPHEDSAILLPSPALAGTFGAGVCGRYHPAGATGTLAAGTTSTVLNTTLTLLANLAPRNGNPFRIRITGGSGAGREFDIISNTSGTNSKIVISNPGNVGLDNTSTFVLMTGRYYVFNAGTLAAGSFKYWDVATATWSAALSITGLAATWATDGRLVATPSAYSQYDRGVSSAAGTTSTLVDSSRTWAVNSLAGKTIRIVAGLGVGQVRRIASNTATVITTTAVFTTAPDATSYYIIEGFDGGMATAGAATTLTDSGKAWTVNQWANAQVRIVAGVGAGQVRVITSNTATALTVAAWTTSPDATSVYIIEGDDNALYLIGNAAVTMYKYSISGNTWSTLAPGVARAAAPAAGANLNWVYGVTGIDWTDITAIKNGRYLYSFRGGVTGTLDAYDIALNTWTSAIAYGKTAETFTGGTGWAYDGANLLYIVKENTGRVFAFDFATLSLNPISLNVYPQGAVTLGDKLILTKFQDGGTVINILYMLRHSGTELHRCLMV